MSILKFGLLALRDSKGYNLPQMTFEEKTKALRNIPIFKVLPISEVKAVAFSAYEKDFPAKYLLIKEGEISNLLYFILGGSLRVYKVTQEGEEINLNICGPGDIVGEMAIIDKAPRSASVETLQAAKVLILKGEDFIKILRVYPEIAIVMLSQLNKRIRNIDQNVEDVLTKNLRERTWKALLTLSNYFPERKILMSHEELASIVGATRARITEILDLLEKENKIILDHKKIQIC